VKRKLKAVNKPLQYFTVHELDKLGSSATVSKKMAIVDGTGRRDSRESAFELMVLNLKLVDPMFGI